MLKYLGTIAPANGATKNNTNTATPFTIPSGTSGLRLLPSAASMYAEVACDAATPSTMAAAVATSYPLGDPSSAVGAQKSLVVRLSTGTDPVVVAVWNGSGGAAGVAVYAILG